MAHLSKQVSLSMNVRGLEQSATIAVNDRCRRLLREGKTVYRLGLGQSPFPVPVPIVEALRQNAHQKDYLPAAGLRELRAAVAEHHRRKDSIEFRPDHVMIGPGSKELMFILQLVYYGELLVPTPAWVSYIPQAKIIGRSVSLIHTRLDDRWRMTADRLTQHCERQNDDYRPRILVLNYPGNPDGCTYTCEELQELADVARRFRVVLLSDEIYGQLHHKGEHCSVARYYPEGTIISSGLSKWCGAGGWRLGTFAFPQDLDWLLGKMVVVASETYTSVCAPVQYAAIRAFQGGVKIERYLCHARRILAALGSQCVAILDAAGIRVPAPEGAFYLFLDFTAFSDRLAARGIADSRTLCERLFEDTGVAILPGQAFGRPAEELNARLAYVDFDGSCALAASETIPLDQPLPAEFTNQLCHNVIEAAHRICEWIKA